MKRHITTFMFVALCGAAVIASFRSKQPETDNVGDFREWLTNPDYRQSAEEYFEARRNLRVPENISDAEIQQMVDRLFVREDHDFNFDRLLLVCGKAVPFVLAALQKPEIEVRRFQNEQLWDQDAPFERICNFLAECGDSRAVQPLDRFINHPQPNFRKHAGWTLANIGAPECIEPVCKILNDADPHVRGFAITGVRSSIRHNRGSVEFFKGVFPALVPLINRFDNSTSDEIPALLLAIDRKQAVPILLSPEYFSIDNKWLHDSINALNATGEKIPHDKLFPLLKEVKPLSGKYPYERHYGAALAAYAHHPDSRAEEIIRAALESPNEAVQTAAAEALAILSGVVKPTDFVFEASDRVGFENLSPPQQHYYAVLIYDSEVNNGGHSQYFINSSGDHWQEAIEGLNAVGATTRASILQEAVALFGPAGPAKTQEARQAQFDTIFEKHESVLEALDDRYYACKENIKTLLALYALANKEHFRTADEK